VRPLDPGLSGHHPLSPARVENNCDALELSRKKRIRAISRLPHGSIPALGRRSKGLLRGVRGRLDVRELLPRDFELALQPGSQADLLRERGLGGA
jgi:hypothetical protein